MKNFVITTDNAADLSKELRQQYEIETMKLSVTINGEEYDCVNKKIEGKKLFDLMRNGSVGTTSQVNPSQAEDFFENRIKEGKDILHIAFSSGLSGTYGSCVIAAENLKSKYPDSKIVVIDSLSASMGQGLLILYACRAKQQGMPMDEIAEKIEEMKNKLCHMFTVDDLNHLQRGGRVSKAAAIVGTLVGIKPVLSCNSQGKLIPITKTRGRKNSLISLVKYMEDTIGDNENKFITISHGDSLEDAKFVAELVREKFGIEEIIICELGPVIGAHSGPGTIALFYVGDHRVDK